MIKELTQANFPGTDLGCDIQSVTYIGFPMPDVNNYTELGLFGSIPNLSVDEFIGNINKLDLIHLYTPGHDGEDNHLWELKAYAKYEATGKNPDKDVVFLYYAPVNS